MDNFLSSDSDVVSFYECEQLVQKIQKFTLEQYGNCEWLSQHELISKLNLQAHINATLRGEEYVMESLVTFDKMSVLLHEVILADVWKREIFPKIKEAVISVPVKSYLAMFHEAALINLLEIVLFHKTALTILDEELIDLIDYCYDKLTILYVAGSKTYPFVSKIAEVLSPTQELDKNLQKINFSVQISCLSIVRYISDHLNELNLSAITFLVNDRDVMSLLIGLIESRPWIVNNSNGRLCFEENEFKKVDSENLGKIPKIEGQVWLTIFNIIFGKESSKMYELTEARKNTLLKLKKYLNEAIIDQIPVLSQMRTFLDQISMSNFPVSQKTNPFIISHIPQIRNSITKLMSTEKVIFFQKSSIWIPNSVTNENEYYKKIGDIYSHQFFPINKEENIKICANCGKEASKKCSRCKTTWYCGKDCQVIHFKSIHKNVCRKKEESGQQDHLKESNATSLQKTELKTENYEELD